MWSKLKPKAPADVALARQRLRDSLPSAAVRGVPQRPSRCGRKDQARTPPWWCNKETLWDQLCFRPLLRPVLTRAREGFESQGVEAYSYLDDITSLTLSILYELSPAERRQWGPSSSESWQLRPGPAKKRTMFPKALAPPLLRVRTWKLETLTLTQRCTFTQKVHEKILKFCFFRLDLAEVTAKTQKHQLFHTKFV